MTPPLLVRVMDEHNELHFTDGILIEVERTSRTSCLVIYPDGSADYVDVSRVIVCRPATNHDWPLPRHNIDV